MANNPSNTNKQGIFMCLDTNTYSFSSSTYGNTKGAIILTIFTILYWTFAFSFLNIFMLLLDTLSKTKPMITYITIYIIIAQKLVRVFIVHERERLLDFMEQSKHNIVTLGEFYDVKASGFEKQTRVHPKNGKQQEYHKVVFKDGIEEHVVKFSRGSITSEFADTETAQIRLTCNFLNSLMKQNIIPKIVLSDERIERAVAFKFYQHKIRTGNFSEEFIDLCNSTLMYHETNAEMYSRISANYFFIPAKSAKQKIYMDNFASSVGSNLSFSTFREISLLTKSQILNIYKDLNGLDAINELALQTEEAKSRVPLGETKSLYVRDVLTGEVKELNKEDIKLKLSIDNIEYKVLKKVSSEEKAEPVKEILSDKEIESQMEDLFNSVELPELKDVLETEVEEYEIDLPAPQEELKVESIIEKVNPYESVKIVDELETLIVDRTFNFKSIEETKSTIDKSVILLNTLQNNECDVIIL